MGNKSKSRNTGKSKSRSKPKFSIGQEKQKSGQSSNRTTIVREFDKKIIPLKDKLGEIYSRHNLETTCKHSCTCCKVAMPGLNYSEFTQLFDTIWSKETREGKLNIVCKSIEYFFKNEFEKFGMETLVKPCMLLSSEGLCKHYEDRPLNCRLYGLWPEEVYNSRVDKFAKAYEGLITKEELPLNKQCPFVKRVDDSIPLTSDKINELFFDLDKLDMKIGEFSQLQVDNKENYRAFHDWVLLKMYGEDGLVSLTQFMINATKDQIIDQIRAFNEVIMDKFDVDGLNVK